MIVNHYIQRRDKHEEDIIVNNCVVHQFLLFYTWNSSSKGYGFTR